ncbi:hypothetical protein ASG22_14950 [Chryseobacterium sp. Leaf405]|uniref:hypothetical protein n=1 Tax=Chryseobacterium sp. Leaf405 TaxID=1736367 RepID=UPI0006F60F53|nr:hypothetical protein [Chryseobacterium sp. Leaf405]KQT22553.1 hypothetical protein ASG22_14950 [Chryseobacterium sp. Leaf405]
MQGIEPKFHNSLTERIEYYRFLLKETVDDPDEISCEAVARASELSDLYQEYLINKRKLEKSIKSYNKYHEDLRKLLTLKIRDLRKKKKAKVIL